MGEFWGWMRRLFSAAMGKNVCDWHARICIVLNRLPFPSILIIGNPKFLFHFLSKPQHSVPTAFLPVLHSLSYLATDIWHCWPPTCRCHSLLDSWGHTLPLVSLLQTAPPQVSLKLSCPPVRHSLLTRAAIMLMPPKTLPFPILEAEWQETWEKVKMVKKAWDRKPVPGAKFWLDQDEAHRRWFYSVFCHT